jgi:hypothetical protein
VIGCGLGEILKFASRIVKVYFERHVLGNFDIRDNILFDDGIFNHLTLFGSNYIQALIVIKLSGDQRLKESLNRIRTEINEALMLLA